jgi:hypothetical protein
MIDLVRLGQVRLCQGKFGLVGFGKDRLGYVRVSLVWMALVRIC